MKNGIIVSFWNSFQFRCVLQPNVSRYILPQMVHENRHTQVPKWLQDTAKSTDKT